MRNRIFFKMLAAAGIVVVIAAITMDVTIRRVWESSLRDEIQRGLTARARLFADRVEIAHQESLQDITSQEALAAGARATVIDPTGQVLADSEADAKSMENHRGRKEFMAALAGNIGVDERRSHTIGVPYLYVAVPVSGGAVRMAYQLSDVEAASQRIHRALLLGSLIAFVIIMLLAALAAHYTARRLQRILRFAEQVSAGDLTARISATSLDEIGQVATALDKTARRVEESFLAVQTSQRQLETLLNSMQDAVIAVGADGRVQWANRGMERLVPQRTRLNAPVVETVRDPQFLAAVRDATEGKKIASARAGSIVPGRSFDVTAAPLPGGGAVAVLRDLTETERVEKTRRDFIANVSHELRTPLTSIQGYTETLLDSTSENGHVREFLEIVRKNAARMSRLTEDLLTLARVESGEQRFDPQPTTPAELLNDAEESFREVVRGQGMELTIEASLDTPVNADREAIHQVFSNLIENAMKYAGSGKRILLGARSVERGVEFYVRDFGPGIPSEHLPRLFERFYRVDKARSRESGGTGLGLAIAKHIVFAHSGVIRAESELNHGSEFSFTLPFAKES
ncbi:MAG: two-component sensor histidine kinase [Acidobacteria bacterium]|nr:MAG: two-component sensor histidine kinase [Acidobacteriota bacterium]